MCRKDFVQSCQEAFHAEFMFVQMFTLTISYAHTVEEILVQEPIWLTDSMYESMKIKPVLKYVLKYDILQYHKISIPKSFPFRQQRELTH